MRTHLILYYYTTKSILCQELFENLTMKYLYFFDIAFVYIIAVTG